MPKAFRLFRRFIPVMLLLGAAWIDVCANLKAADKAMISAKEFGQLPVADQRALVAAAFERRLRLAENLHYEVKIASSNHEYDDGKVGELVPNTSYWDRFDNWLLNGSYRTDTNSYPDSDSESPQQSVSSGFDVSSGTSRAVARLENRAQGHSARIDTVHDPILQTNRYSLWLAGEFPHKADFLFQDLLTHKDQYEFEIIEDGKLVRLKSPWVRPYRRRPTGQRLLDLDPQRDFLPVRGVSEWDQPTANGTPSWRHEEFTVFDSREVDGVWMPTRMEELIGGAPLGRNQVNTFRLEVLKIDAGDVTPEQIEVHFPEGTEVLDSTKGVTYRVDKQEKPIGPIQGLVGEDAVSAMPPPGEPATSPINRGVGIVFLNVGAAILIGGLWFSKKKRPRIPS